MPSQTFHDMQVHIRRARAGLLAMSRQAANWRKINEAAAIHLKTASKWEGVETKKAAAKQAPG